MTFRMHKKTIHTYRWAVILIVLLAFIGCKSKTKTGVSTTPDGKQSTAKEIFDRAKKQIRKNPEKSRLMFKEIIHIYPDSPYAARSKVGIGDSYFKQKDAASLIMAAAEYQEYVSLYPNSPDSVYAKMQIAMCYYKQLRKAGRDQENTFKAIKALEDMVRMYPDTNEAAEARKMIAKSRQTLARHYFLIGVSNFRLGALRGALARFKQVIDEYPDFKFNDRLYYFTGRTYFRMRNYDVAISFFQRVTTNFPKSKFLKKSQKMIKKVNLAKADPTMQPMKPPTAPPKTEDKPEKKEGEGK